MVKGFGIVPAAKQTNKNPLYLQVPDLLFAVVTLSLIFHFEDELWLKMGSRSLVLVGVL